MAAGGYSALIINGQVGPEGGRILVEATVKAIDRLWDPNAETKKMARQKTQGV
jgi:hypothetical protein